MWICEKWGLPEEIIEIVGYHHTPFKGSNNDREVKVMFLADSLSTNYYEKLLGTEITFIHTDRVREELNLSKELLDRIAGRLPEEVEKISRNRFLDFI